MPVGLDAELGVMFAVSEDPARGASAMSIVYRGQLKTAAPIASPAVLVALVALPRQRIRDAAIDTMLRRYMIQRCTGTIEMAAGGAVMARRD